MSPEVRHEELEVSSSTDKDFESDDSRTSQDELRDKKKHNDDSTTAATNKPQLMLRANTFSFNLISLEPRPDGILDEKKSMVAAEETAG